MRLFLFAYQLRLCYNKNMKVKKHEGWTKRRQEEFPEGWAIVHAALKIARIGKGHNTTDYQRKRAREVNLGNTHRLGKPKSKAECEKISKSSVGKKGTRNGVKESEATRLKKSISIRAALAKRTLEQKTVQIEKFKKWRATHCPIFQDTSIEIALQNELIRRGIVFEKQKAIY